MQALRILFLRLPLGLNNLILWAEDDPSLLSQKNNVFTAEFNEMFEVL